MQQYRLGIDVGGTKIAYGLFDESYRLVSRLTEPSRPELSAEDMLDVLCGQIDGFLSEQSLSRSGLSCVGLAIPGHIHFERGLVVSASNLPNWKGVPIRDLLKTRLGVPVLLDNDANVAALAEYRMGAGRGSKNLVYLTISTGIGCGLILSGALFRGSYGAAGEIGHTTIRSQSRIVCGWAGRAARKPSARARPSPALCAPACAKGQKAPSPPCRLRASPPKKWQAPPAKGMRWHSKRSTTPPTPSRRCFITSARCSTATASSTAAA